MREELSLQKDAPFKDIKYDTIFDEKVLSQWHSEDKEVADAVNQWAEFIKKNSLLREFNLKHIEGDKSFDIQKEFELAPQKKIWIGVRK